MKTYDTVVVGGGPGGYVAAIRAAQLGCSVALIEQAQLGGTCLNTGCIPSKTLIRHAEIVDQIRKAQSWGIETGAIAFSLEKMMARKQDVIHRLRAGIAALLKAQKVEVYEGYGEVSADRTIAVRMADKSVVIQARSVILATGSKPFIPPIEGIDQAPYHTTDTIFDIGQIPTSIAIIGGGFIGVEFACIFAGLDVDVTVIEMEDRIVANEDADAAKLLHRELNKKQVNICTQTSVRAMKHSPSGTTLTLQSPDGSTKERTFDQVLVAVGRTPNTSGLTRLGLEMKGPHVTVNRRMETSVPHIYAVGDLAGGWQLAHVASAEGLVAAANAANGREEINYRIVPRCIYTLPEIASIGLSEEEARKLGYAVKTQTYPFAGNGKALAMDDKEGFVKIIADPKYGEILGAVIAGPHATEMISEMSAYVHLEGTVEELGKMTHPHPTLSEAIFEAANAWLGKRIH